MKVATMDKGVSEQQGSSRSNLKNLLNFGFIPEADVQPPVIQDQGNFNESTIGEMDCQDSHNAVNEEPMKNSTENMDSHLNLNLTGVHGDPVPGGS